MLNSISKNTIKKYVEKKNFNPSIPLNAFVCGILPKPCVGLTIWLFHSLSSRRRINKICYTTFVCKGDVKGIVQYYYPSVWSMHVTCKWCKDHIDACRKKKRNETFGHSVVVVIKRRFKIISSTVALNLLNYPFADDDLRAFEYSKQELLCNLWSFLTAVFRIVYA